MGALLIDYLRKFVKREYAAALSETKFHFSDS
jgi:hypothetical protein